ncbi:hypothetical protein RhiJN_12812 [Ceratobasidium sp. AG-Ba]|nr:hypothetical protein RhiJN_12812 [Ceratobasidium sp. AG-Ba]
MYDEVKDHTVWDIPLHGSLASDAFVSTEHLYIIFDRKNDAQSFWDRLVFKSLARLSVAILSSFYGPEDHIGFISKIYRAYPRLKKLRLRFIGYLEPYGRLMHIPTKASRQLFKIRLDDAFDLVRMTLSVRNVWARMAAAWPGLKRVACFHQKATLEELILLSSKLPNLEYLECDLDFKAAVDTIGRAWEPEENARFYPSLRQMYFKQLDLEKYESDGQDRLDNVAG